LFARASVNDEAEATTTTTHTINIDGACMEDKDSYQLEERSQLFLTRIGKI
jgi:hypothetical protein